MVILAAVSINAAYNSGIINYAVNGTQEYAEGASAENTALASAEGIMDSVLARLENLQGGAGGRLLDSLEASDTTTATQPYLPGTSFKKVAGTSLSTGLVIEDTSTDGNGNQFVWIEVPKTIYSNNTYTAANNNTAVTSAADYTGIEKILHAYASDYRNSNFSDTYDSNMGTIGNIEDGDDYTALYHTMLSSIYTHGGFWIGRYETGISQEENPRTEAGTTTQTAVITKDAYPYNYVTLSQAQTLASGVNSGNCTSSLMFGIQWDLVLRYLEAKGTDQQYLIYTEDANENPGPGSTSWGNYGDAPFAIISTGAKYNTLDENRELTSWKLPTVDTDDYVESGTKLANNDDWETTAGVVLLTTGANETRNSKMNIIDLAGNVAEWTLEYSGDSYSPCTVRGGDCGSYGWNYPAGDRNYCGAAISDSSYGNVGFRISLY